jgi:hypothetical protein
MFYTVTAAAKIAGLNKSTVLAAIETGQITGTKDLFGEWKITDSDLHRLCVAVKEGTTHEGPQQYAPPDGTNVEAEIAELVRDASDSLRQSFDEKDHEEQDQYQQLERSQSLLAGLKPWSATLAQGGEVVVSESWQRVIVMAAGALAVICVCWIANQSLSTRGSAAIVPSENVRSSFPIPSFENEKIGITPTQNNGDTTSNAQTTRQLATATPMSRAGDSPQSANRASPTVANPISSVPQQKSTSPKLADLASQPQRKIPPRPVPVPETRPITIQSWTILEVVGDGVILQGPNGIWMVTRGGTVPGLGKVNSIVIWGKRWIVVTNKGLISTP